MTKKLITTALGCAFSISAIADVNISGAYVWGHTNTNGATETEKGDAYISVVSTTETANGLTVSADFNINADGDNDGGNSLTVAGAFGKLDLGDTSSAVDKIDDITDWGYFQTTGTSAPDHAVLYTLPTIVEGLDIHASYAADTNVDGNSGGTSLSARYDFGVARVGYGILNNDNDTEAKIMNARFKIAGVGLGYEGYTTTDASNVDTDNTAVSATYTIDNVTLAYENVTVESQGTTSSDTTAFGIHYEIAPELTAFVETSEDDKTASSKATTIGIAYAF